MLTNTAGSTLVVNSSTINAPLVNEGLLVNYGSSAINGSFSNAAGATLELAGQTGWNLYIPSNLTFANGLTNQGVIELVGGTSDELVVSRGTLVNKLGGTIHFVPGNNGDTLTAELDNEGTLQVDCALTIAMDSAQDSNSGTINVSGGNLTINQSGTDPSLSNTGTITIDTGQTLTVNGGTFKNRGVLDAKDAVGDLNSDVTNNGQGILLSQPLGTVYISGSLTGDTTNADQFAPQGVTCLDGSGTAATPQVLEVMSQDLGDVAAGFVNNFVYGALSLANNTYAQLANDSHNSAGTGPEGLYVNELIVPSGCTLDLNGLNVYVRAMQINGAIVGGTVNVLPGGGSIPWNSWVPGNVLAGGDTHDWLFYGWAGQAVSVFVATGNGNSPAPLTPQVNSANVQIEGPNGMELASGTTQSSVRHHFLPGVVVANRRSIQCLGFEFEPR